MLRQLMNVLFVSCFAVLSSMVLVSCSGDDEAQEEQLEVDQIDDSAEAPGQEGIDIDGNPTDITDPLPGDLEAGLGGGDDIGGGLGVDQAGLGGGDADVAAPEAQTGDGQVDQSSLQYMVRRGDTLSAVAQRVYGDKFKWQMIHEATPGVSNPNKIYPGDILNIPLSDAASQAFASDYRQNQGTSGQITYTVQSGDTLGKIAAQHMGHSGGWRAIWEQNRGQISNPNVIEVGQTLTFTGVSH